MTDRIRLYLTTLIIPFMLLLIIVITDGQSFFEIIMQNWFHVLPGLLVIIFGIEIFKGQLSKDIKARNPYFAGFIFVMKIWLLESVVNLMTNLIEGLTNGIDKNFFIWLYYLVVISFMFYILMAVISSMIIGWIVGKYALKS